MTRNCGVIGFPWPTPSAPASSSRPSTTWGWTSATGAYETPPEALAPFFASLRAGGWLGCNVTIPHKQAVFDLVDAVSEEASLIGAVNTVVCEPGGRLSGHNTDAAGFLRALTESAGYDPAGQRGRPPWARGGGLAAAVALLRAGPAGCGSPTARTPAPRSWPAPSAGTSAPIACGPRSSLVTRCESRFGRRACWSTAPAWACATAPTRRGRPSRSQRGAAGAPPAGLRPGLQPGPDAPLAEAGMAGGGPTRRACPC